MLNQLKRMRIRSNTLAAAAVLVGTTGIAMAQGEMRFTCGASKTTAGVTALSATSMYAEGKTAGFDLAPAPVIANGSCSSDKPFFFSAPVPDGNYRVLVVLGGDAPSTNTIKAESRRLFVMERAVAAKKSTTEEFVVNVRTAPIIVAGGPTPPKNVKLKPREIGALDWDNKLTLEFNGEHPSIRSISITPVHNVPTIYLAGDSTVVDQDKEPWAAWGQMMPMFFGPNVSIANDAESGETIRSFVGELRLEKVMSTIQPGDYLMIQFAHNDQKTGAGYVPAATDYKTFLKSYISQARAHGATPVLVTSMNRRNFDANGKIVQTLGDYPEAMRQVGAEEHVAVIDLNAMSKTLFEAMGPEGTLKAFVHYPANTFPDQKEELKDETHFNAYGGYELARCVVQSMRDQKLPMAAFLQKNLPTFDPAKPDALATWHLPASPFVQTETPYGR